MALPAGRCDLVQGRIVLAPRTSCRRCSGCGRPGPVGRVSDGSARRVGSVPQTEPGVVAMWVRQCDLDTGSDDLPPIPSRIASNEEFVPPPQSAEQKEYEDRLAGIS